MRTPLIAPLALSAAVLAGCVGESPERANQETGSRAVETGGVPDRDLRLTPATQTVTIASPVELSRPIAGPEPTRRPKSSPKPAPASAPAPNPVPDASPAVEAVVASPAVMAEVQPEPAPVDDASVGVGRELAPGKTVTVIPASSGPSSAPEDPSWTSPGRARSIYIGGGGGGGTCRPRGGGRGIGIAGRIPIGVPGRRLR